MGFQPQLVAHDAHAAEAVDHALPDAAHGRRVNARVGGGHHRAKVGSGSTLEEGVGHVVQPQISRQHGVGGTAQRGIVQGAFFVIEEVLLFDLRAEQLFQQEEQHQHVGLLAHLDPADLLEVVVVGDRAHHGSLLVFGQVDVGQVKIAVELRQNAVRALPRQVQLIQHLADLVGRCGKVQLPVQPLVDRIAPGFQLSHHFQRRAHVVGGHVVGVGVVVHMLLVFVGADDVGIFVAVMLRLPFRPAGPEAGRVDDDFIAIAIQEILIAGGPEVLLHRKGNIHRDVQLQNARPNFGGLAGDHVRCAPERRDLAVVLPCGFPRIHRTLAAVFGGFFPGTGQRVVAVFQQSAGRFGLGEQEIGENENFRIPEGMALVAFAAETLGPDAYPIVILQDEAVHVVLSETDGQLVEFVFAVDLDVDLLPQLLPCVGAFGKQMVIPQRFGFPKGVHALFFQLLHRESLVFPAGVPAGIHGAELFHPQGLPLLQAEGGAAGNGAAADDGQAVFLSFFAVHPIAAARKLAAGDAGVQGLAGHAQDAQVVQALGAFVEMLRALVGHLTVDAAFHGKLHIAVQRSDLHAQTQHMLAGHGYEAGEAEGQLLAQRALPHQRALHFAGVEIQRAHIFFRLALQHAEGMAVHADLQLRHVRQVGQLRHFPAVEIIEGARHQQIRRAAYIVFLQRSPLAQIAVALRKNGFAFALIAAVEFRFRHQPVAVGALPQMVVHHSFVTPLRRSPLRKPAPAPAPALGRARLYVPSFCGLSIAQTESSFNSFFENIF